MVGTFVTLPKMLFCTLKYFKKYFKVPQICQLRFDDPTNYLKYFKNTVQLQDHLLYLKIMACFGQVVVVQGSFIHALKVHHLQKPEIGLTDLDEDISNYNRGNL